MVEPTLFNSLEPENRRKRQATHEMCRQFNRAPSKGHLKKLSCLFNKFGEHLLIEQGFHCDYGDKISFGDRVFLNVNCTLLDGAEINIGDDALIGPNVQILTVNHPTNSTVRLDKTNLVTPVIIGNNVWIGAGAIILPGVSIADDSVIAAGSVVTNNVAKNTLVAGNPAKFVKPLN